MLDWKDWYMFQNVIQGEQFYSIFKNVFNEFIWKSMCVSKRNDGLMICIQIRLYFGEGIGQ